MWMFHDYRLSRRPIMQEFYRKSLIVLVLIAVANALVAWFCIDRSYLSLPLQDAKAPHWHYLVETDASRPGKSEHSTAKLEETTRDRLRFAFRLASGVPYPYLSASLVFDDGKGREVQRDLSRYSTVSFVAKCTPGTALSFFMSTFDPNLSKPGQFLSYRSPVTYFSCDVNGVPVTLDLNRLFISQWWFEVQNLDLARQGYLLDRVARIGFGTSAQSPQRVDANVEIADLTLRGRDYRYLWEIAIVATLSVGMAAVWFCRSYARVLRAHLATASIEPGPLCVPAEAPATQEITHKQTSLQPYKEAERMAILRFIAVNFTSPDLDLESVVSGTGANRNKINEILKSELGLTFTAYLNKLRLAEAGRLLATSKGKAVAEIASAVGYGNVSYFNKLFKETYGCTPRIFRTRASPGEAVSADPQP